MMRRLLILLLLAAGPAQAVQPDEVLDDPALEARAREISRELRCLVCQNQSIDDSDAALAKDLRVIVRERLQAGDTDREVLDYVVARYGAFVRMTPPFDAGTVLLWLGPLWLLLIGGAVVYVTARRAGRLKPADAPLTPEEEAKLKAALNDADPNR